MDNKSIFKNKNIFIIATMGLFSGDGAGCAARLLKKANAKIVGGIHIKMPDCIGDVKLLKKSIEENKEIIVEADKKIKQAVKDLKNEKPSQDGLKFFHHIAGLFGQRLWFRTKVKSYTDNLKINRDKCIGCGKCADLCPMNNLKLIENKSTASGRCTMCYRCINNCPRKAITLLGDKVFEQSRIEKYI